MSTKSHQLENAEMPKLRFREFSDRWKAWELKNVSRIYDGTHQTPNYVKEGIPFYSVEHLTANNFSKTKFISKDVFDKENKKIKIEKNDILMTRIGDIGTARHVDWDANASFYVSLALIKPFKEINSLFLSKYISSLNFQRELWKRTIHVAFPKKINLGEIGECKLFAPSISEQKKIARSLELSDKWIENLKGQKESFESYKKGMMQKLFSQEIRFKDDKGKEFPKWEEKKIGDIFETTRGNVLAMPKVSKIPTDEYRYPVYSSQTTNNGLSGYYKSYLFEDCITWTTDGANAGDVKFRSGKFYCTNVCGVLKSDIGYANVCVAEIFNTISKKYVSYVGNPKLMNNVVSTIKISIPTSVIEQEKISSFLTSVDKVIESKKQQITQAELWKKGLMQGLFV